MARQSRNTRQKELIAQAIARKKTFFSAEDLYETLHQEGIGMATIYRALKEMSSAGELHAYQCDRRQIYSKDKKSHCHFICEETGKVIHFDISSLDFLKNKIPGDISSFQIEVRGVCKDHK